MHSDTRTHSGSDISTSDAPAYAGHCLQARRLDIRLRTAKGPEGESKKEFVHMLNGTLSGELVTACTALRWAVAESHTALIARVHACVACMPACVLAWWGGSL